MERDPAGYGARRPPERRFATLLLNVKCPCKQRPSGRALVYNRRPQQRAASYHLAADEKKARARTIYGPSKYSCFIYMLVLLPQLAQRFVSSLASRRERWNKGPDWKETKTERLNEFVTDTDESCVCLFGSKVSAVYLAASIDPRRTCISRRSGQRSRANRWRAGSIAGPGAYGAKRIDPGDPCGVACVAQSSRDQAEDDA